MDDTTTPGAISVDQFKQTLPQQASNVAPTPQPAPTTPVHSGNWFTHLLPTIGGIAAPILGGLLAPETGGLSLIAAAGLSGLGSAAGKAAENATENKGLGDNVVTSGLEGAAGGAVGGVAGKALGAVAGKLGGAAENLATNQAAQDTTDTIAQRYGGLKTSLQGNLGAKDLLLKAKDLGYDISDPNNLVQAGDAANYHLNNIVDKAITDAGPIDMSDYTNIVKDALAKQGKILGSYEPVGMSRGRLGPANTPAAKLLSQLEDLGAGVAKSQSDPTAVRGLTTDLYSLRGDYPQIGANGVVDRNEKAIYNVIDQVRNDVKNRLYGNPAVDENLSKLQGTIAPDVSTGVTPQLADHLNGIISNAGSNGRNAADDLLEEMSHNYDLKNLGNAALKNDQVVTTKAGQGRLASDLGSNNVTGNDVSQGVSKGGALMAAMHGHPIAALGTILPHVANNPQILSTLSRIGALAPKVAPAAGVMAATAPGMGAGPVATANGAPSGMGASNGIMDGSMQNGTQSPLNQLYQTLLANYNASGGITSNDATLAQALSTLAPQVQKNNMLNTEMSGMPELYANAGGAQGLGGIMSQISGLIPGTAANRYNTAVKGLQPQLTQAGINPMLLPSLMNNGQSADISQSILGGLQHQLTY